MVRKPKKSSEVYTAYDNFLYLLAELELVVGSGTIRWSASSASRARQRMDVLAATMGRLANKFESE